MSATNLVITAKGRENLVKARAGDITLPAITGMAFGSGGVYAGGTPIAPSSSATALNNEIGRRTISSHTYPNATTCRYVCTLSASDFPGAQINELGLYDSNGDLVCIKTFTTKGKDADIELTFTVDDEF